MGPSKDKRSEAADIRRRYRAEKVEATEKEQKRADEAAAKAAEKKGGEQ